MLNGNDMTIHLMVGLIKKTLYKWANTFLSHQIIKKILKLRLIFIIMQQKLILKITHVDTSNFALKTNLANLKTEVDKLDIDKLVPIPADLSKLSNAVKNRVVKKLNTIN